MSRPFSISSVGIGAWTIVSQARQLIFGRTCYDALKVERNIFEHLALVRADAARICPRRRAGHTPGAS
jgi:hypothetical protein